MIKYSEKQPFAMFLCKIFGIKGFGLILSDRPVNKRDVLDSLRHQCLKIENGDIHLLFS